MQKSYNIINILHTELLQKTNTYKIILIIHILLHTNIIFYTKKEGSSL